MWSFHLTLQTTRERDRLLAVITVGVSLRFAKSPLRRRAAPNTANPVFLSRDPPRNRPPPSSSPLHPLRVLLLFTVLDTGGRKPCGHRAGDQSEDLLIRRWSSRAVSDKVLESATSSIYIYRFCSFGFNRNRLITTLAAGDHRNRIDDLRLRLIIESCRRTH